MRIVHVYKDYFPPSFGGMEQVVARMARQQARDGHEVTILASSPGRRRTTRDDIDGVHVIRCAEFGRVTSAPRMVSQGSPARRAMLTISATLPFDRVARMYFFFMRWSPGTESGHGSRRQTWRL